MKGRPGKIYFVHEGKESYPEIAAYRSFFAGLYETGEIAPRALSRKEDLGDAICWHIMGLYPSRPDARLVIHDYRSLSLAPLAETKDLIKRKLNARPGLRIFQNEAVRDVMRFCDDVPSVLLPMGVPPEILSFRDEMPAPNHDFCYIGVLSKERKSHLMLDSFLKRYDEGKTFLLFGAAEPYLIQRYRTRSNIIFAGKKTQKEVFSALRRVRAAVNYFPAHRPHCFQTPTKLLEYAALGLRIVSNEQQAARAAAERYGIHCLWGDAEDMFANAPDALDWKTNETLDPSAFLWPDVIARSGLPALIDKVLA